MGRGCRGTGKPRNRSLVDRLGPTRILPIEFERLVFRFDGKGVDQGCRTVVDGRRLPRSPDFA
jgi:hypothetical protein